MCRLPQKARVVAILLVLAAATAATAFPPPRFAADRPMDMTHIRLDVNVDLEAKTLKGKATLAMSALRPVSTIDLDAVNFKISAVRLAIGDGPAADCEYEYDNRRIRLALPREIGPGTAVRAQIEYAVKDPTSGLSFYAPSEEEPDTPHLVWSQGQTTTNRYWVPSFDHPNERQTTEIVCTAKKPNTVISNGKMLEESDNGDGTRTFHWLQDKDHPVYLMTLVVGEFASKTENWRGKPVIYYVRPKYADRIDGAFGNTTRMLDFFSDKIGVEYPWDKYAQVCCYAFGGGMENTSSTTLGEGALRDERGRLTGSSDDLIAHELAHQWWGDLLTCREWAHTWLNEGFATYFEALWEEHDKGPDAFAVDMLNKMRSALRAGVEKPIVYRHYEDENEQFDGRAYPKGAWVLHMIRRRLGDELFWKCINTYCKRFAHQTVETVDLRKTIEEGTGRSFEHFFYDWTERPGHPEVTLSYAWIADDDVAEIRVRQTQKAEAFHFPLKLVVHVSDEAPRVVTREIVDKETRILVPLSEPPSLLQIDPEQAVLMDLKIEMPRELWVARLTKDPNAAARITAAEHFGDSEAASDAELLATRLKEEKYWSVRRTIAAQLREVGGDAARDALLACVEEKEARVRSAVVSALGGFRGDKLVQAALKKLIDDGDPSSDVEQSAIQSYAAARPEGALDVLKACLNRDSDRDAIRAAALRGLGELRDAEAADLLIEWSKPGKSLEARGAAVSGLGRLLGDADLEADVRAKALDAVAGCAKVKARRLQMSALTALGQVAGDTSVAVKLVEQIAKDARGRTKSMAERIATRMREGRGPEEPGDRRGGRGLGRSARADRNDPRAGDGSADLREKIEALEKENEEMRERLERLENRMQRRGRAPNLGQRQDG